MIEFSTFREPSEPDPDGHTIMRVTSITRKGPAESQTFYVEEQVKTRTTVVTRPTESRERTESVILEPLKMEPVLTKSINTSTLVETKPVRSTIVTESVILEPFENEPVDGAKNMVRSIDRDR